jgi:hypothetical protein
MFNKKRQIAPFIIFVEIENVDEERVNREERMLEERMLEERMLEETHRRKLEY